MDPETHSQNRETMSALPPQPPNACTAHLEQIALDLLPPGQLALVSSIEAQDADLARLMAMGVCIGRQVRMVQAGDPMILFVLGARIGVSSRMGKRVMVSPCPTIDSQGARA
jgi:Fe2+ transport system protein FeoA